MDIVLHHIHPWMQKSNAEAEDRIEKRVSQKTEQKIQAVNQRLNAFMLRVLASPSPIIEFTTL